MEELIELINKYSHYLKNSTILGINLDLCDYSVRFNTWGDAYCGGGFNYSLIDKEYGELSTIKCLSENDIKLVKGSVSVDLKELSNTSIEKLKDNLNAMIAADHLRVYNYNLVIKCKGIAICRIIFSELILRGFLNLDTLDRKRGDLYIHIHKNGFKIREYTTNSFIIASNGCLNDIYIKSHISSYEYNHLKSKLN